MGNCHVVGPNEVMVISGGCPCFASQNNRIITGGCGWAWAQCTTVQKLSLNVMTLLPKCDNVETRQGVSLTVADVAQVMVMCSDHMGGEGKSKENRDAFLQKALEQFLGKSSFEISTTIRLTLEGHLRAILGTLTVEEVYRDREHFAQMVRDTAIADLAKMGLEILSFTIKDVSDKHNYLDSLGKAQIAIVTRDATIGQAEAKRDWSIRVAECEKAFKEIQNDADRAVANAQREKDLAQSGFSQEVNQKKAEANMAYDLAKAKLQQEIRREEIQIEVVEKRRQIDVMEAEVLRKEKELVATIHRSAEADRFQVETIAEGNQKVKVFAAQAEAERIKAVGGAEAAVIAAVGEAMSKSMKVKASAYKSYGDAAVLSLVLEALPAIAQAVAAPLARTKDIILLPSGDSGGLANDVTRLIGTLPPAVQALTGIDLTQSLKNALKPKA